MVQGIAAQCVPETVELPSGWVCDRQNWGSDWCLGSRPLGKECRCCHQLCKDNGCTRKHSTDVNKIGQCFGPGTVPSPNVEPTSWKCDPDRSLCGEDTDDCICCYGNHR